MAAKRMIKIDLVTSDAFLDMPLTAQGLFFHLCVRADDDGFIDCVNKIIRECQASKEDFEILKQNRYVLTFPNSNVIVIKHWNLHNSIPKDRYKPTNYTEEKALLYQKENGAYTFDVSKMSTKCKQNVTTDKSSKDKNRVYTRKSTKNNSFMNFDQREQSDEFIEQLETDLLEIQRKDNENGTTKSNT